MPPKKDLCRNFQRGSCQYGNRCKFLHSTTQQPQSPFGFGVQNGSNFHSPAFKQQNQNPFGFGVKSDSQPNRGANYQGSTQSFQPFQNKWTRDSSNTASSQQNQNQSQASNHKCTDPESCKRIIIEDFEHERPLWKLTCYGHFKYLPCDVTGDISYEELRAAAYDDGKRGMSLQSIVERERSLQQAKLVEMDNFSRSPHISQLNSSQNIQNPVPFGVTTSPSIPQNLLQSPTPNVGQLGSSLNMGFGTRSPPLSPGPFGQFSGVTQASGPFGSGNMMSGHAGEGFFSNMNSNTQAFKNSGPSVQSGLNTPVSPAYPNVMIPANTQHHNAFVQTTPAVDLMNNHNERKENPNVDPSIWLKKEWKLGEIPEDIPPDEYIR